MLASRIQQHKYVSMCYSLYLRIQSIFEQALQNAPSSVCPDTGAILDDAVSRDHFTQKLTGLFEILYSTSSTTERASIISRAFDGLGRLSHLDRMARKVAVEIDTKMTKVEASMQEQETNLLQRLSQIESLPAYMEMQRVGVGDLADSCNFLSRSSTACTPLTTQ